MEILFIVILALYFCFVNQGQENATEEGLEEEVTIRLRETRVNPELYDDPDAFMRIAHVLGF